MIQHLDKHSDDDDSIFSLGRFFVTIVQIFVPVYKMQLHTDNIVLCTAANEWPKYDVQISYDRQCNV